MAIEVLRRNAETLVGVFGAGIVKLSTHCAIERVPSVDQETLGERGKHLSGEDRQVLADALAARASVLYTHDSEFFKERIPDLIVMAPGGQAHDPFGPLWFLPNTTDWTFLGWFVPNWGSDLVRQTTNRFCIFEIAGHVKCYYEASRGEFVVEWTKKTPGKGPLRLLQEVKVRDPNFVAVTATTNSIALFANGETRGGTVTIGRAPNNTTFHPFNNSTSTGQIEGGCQFRFVDEVLNEGSVRKHWTARTLQLTDGEIKWMDAVRKLSMLSAP